jgi:hypothetical protein
MRKVSQGKYWTQKMEQKIAKSKADVFIVTDIRYDVYPEDECTWLQNKMAGKLVHVTRYMLTTAPSKRRITTSKPVKVYEAALNEHELFNNPKCKAKADYAFEWEDVSRDFPSMDALKESEYINNCVAKALESIGVLPKS